MEYALLLLWLLLLTADFIVADYDFSLRFKSNGQFKILQVADQHYANGASSGCEDVLPSQFDACSDLNTTAFINRVIAAEKPDLIVFSGDNIFGADCNDSATSQVSAFAPAVDAKIPWVAVLGNHDQEGNLDREQLMQHIVAMEHTLTRINPLTKYDFQHCLSSSPDFDSCNTTLTSIEGFGNYNLEIGGVNDSALAAKSVLNLYFLDSGDQSTITGVDGYGWIKSGQRGWFSHTSSRLQAAYQSEPVAQKELAPALTYFHMPLPEFNVLDALNMTGVKQEDVCSANVNSGFFATMLEAGDVKGVFVGHDHVNDFCGKLLGINLCYAGGVGYHAYGSAGWSRRTRVVLASLEKDDQGGWLGVNQIQTWKCLDDDSLSIIDQEILWTSAHATQEYTAVA